MFNRFPRAVVKSFPCAVVVVKSVVKSFPVWLSRLPHPICCVQRLFDLVVGDSRNIKKCYCLFDGLARPNGYELFLLVGIPTRRKNQFPRSSDWFQSDFHIRHKHINKCHCLFDGLAWLLMGRPGMPYQQEGTIQFTADPSYSSLAFMSELSDTGSVPFSTKLITLGNWSWLTLLTGRVFIIFEAI